MEDEKTASNPSQMTILQAIVFFIALVAIAVFLAWLKGVPWRTILTVNAIGAVLLTLGLLNSLNKRFREGKWIERGIAAYFTFLFWMVVFILPMWVIMMLSRQVVTLARPFQVVIFIAWGVLLSFAIWLVSTEQKRLWLFRWAEARKIGRFTPIAYTFNLLMIAIIFFASITYLSAHNRISRAQEPDKPVTVDSIQDFYLWHFLEAVPLLRVNDTIGWKPPMKHEGHLVGWILLLFKLAVIIPIIACFASYWRNFGVSKSAAVTGRQ